jgi:hypothetical protein
MAKAKKKPASKASASKSGSKSGSKSHSKANKGTSKSAATGKSAAKREAKKSSLAKTLVKAAGKVFGGKDNAKASKAKPVKAAAPAPMTVKPTKAAKPAKKKGKKEGFEEDELLVQDDEMGSEEIPDLSEFEAEEVEEEMALESTDDSLEATSEVTAATTPSDDEVYLTDAEGRRYCRVRDCDQASIVEGYCRFHYLQLWKRIQVRRKILTDGKLERYVDELTSRYPDKFLEMIRKDLKTEKDFLTAIAELEIDESVGENDLEDETQSYIDEVRGLSTETGMTEEEEF